MPCFSPLNGYVNRKSGGLTFRREEHAGNKMTVACGQCLGCRLDNSRMWAARIVHESTQHDHNGFITLTYRPKDACTKKQLTHKKHEPEDGSLDKSHFRDFMKRLRKQTNHKLKYFHVGEYGEKLQRPHYHACLFGMRFSDEVLFDDTDGNYLWTSQILEDTWGYGFATVGELSFESAAYCARYCLAKITGIKAQDHYLRADDYGVAYWLKPEYITMSRGRKPGQGIGGKWYENYKDDVFPSDEIPVPGSGVFPKVPRYYEEILKSENPQQLEEIKNARKVFFREHAGEYTPERLMAKYKVQQAKTTQLKRGMK